MLVAHPGGMSGKQVHTGEFRQSSEPGIGIWHIYESPRAFRCIESYVDDDITLVKNEDRAQERPWGQC